MAIEKVGSPFNLCIYGTTKKKGISYVIEMNGHHMNEQYIKLGYYIECQAIYKMLKVNR